MPRTILAVDDERSVLRVVQLSLERAGYRVITTANGQDALRKIMAEHPDLVILDAILPGKTGIEVLREIRWDRTMRHLPVIILTAKAQNLDALCGCTEHVDSYLTKPFHPDELVTCVHRLLTENTTDENEDDAYKL